MRIERPVKVLRRTPVEFGETDQTDGTAGAKGQTTRRRRRPGRAASLKSSSARSRSQRWRNPKKGARRVRKGNAAKGTRTARAKTK